MPRCWICNKNEATTGEHIFKDSILRAMFGHQAFPKGKRLILHKENVYNGRVVISKKYLESTAADALMFSKSLCAVCNGSRSQSWDRGFDKFVFFLFDGLEKSDHINLKDVHHGYGKKDVRNLYNYFCKLFGCLLYTNNQSIPRDIVDIVNGLNYKNQLGINVTIDTNFCENKIVLKNGDLTGGQYEGNICFKWKFSFCPFNFYLWYGTQLDITAKLWYGKSKLISFSGE